MTISSCNICSELQKTNSDSRTKYYEELISSGRNIIFESAHFVVIPSYGPLNCSHAMIVPKRHVNNFASLSENELTESRSVITTLSDFYRKKHNKELIYFESGAGELSSHSGGCVVHAHIHCVVQSENFRKRVFEEIDLMPLKFGGWKSLDTEFGYVWIRDIDTSEYGCNRPLLPSQFLRYLYLQGCETELKWNWRKDINDSGISQVIKEYDGICT